MIITIDGPAGTGKSTVAKEVASKLHFAFFDTGAMYRAVAWDLFHKDIVDSDEKAIEEALRYFVFSISVEGNERRYFVGDKDVTAEIRSHEVTMRASRIAKLLCVREKVWEIQRELGKLHDAVFEGRDMGTTVFPKADLKFFLTADPEVRAQRRFDELSRQSSGKKKTFEEVLQDMVERDEADSSRNLSPLKKAEDAITIDTSVLTIDEVVSCIIYHYRLKMDTL